MTERAREDKKSEDDIGRDDERGQRAAITTEKSDGKCKARTMKERECKLVMKRKQC